MENKQTYLDDKSRDVLDYADLKANKKNKRWRAPARRRRKGAAVMLMRTYSEFANYSRTIERTRSIALVPALCDSYDHIIFHEATLPSAHKKHILEQIGKPLNDVIKFMDIDSVFHSRDASINVDTKKAARYKCPGNSRTRGFPVSYHAMCAFWFIDIVEILSPKYSHFLRIDDDCLIVNTFGTMLHDPAVELLSAGKHIAAVSYPSDAEETVTGLVDFFEELADDPDHPERQRFEAPLRNGRLELVSPYTNVMWLDLEWARSETVQSVLRAVDETGCILSNRWGDLILYEPKREMMVD